MLQISQTHQTRDMFFLFSFRGFHPPLHLCRSGRVSPVVVVQAGRRKIFLLAGPSTCVASHHWPYLIRSSPLHVKINADFPIHYPPKWNLKVLHHATDKNMHQKVHKSKCNFDYRILIAWLHVVIFFLSFAHESPLPCRGNSAERACHHISPCVAKRF